MAISCAVAFPEKRYILFIPFSGEMDMATRKPATFKPLRAKTAAPAAEAKRPKTALAEPVADKKKTAEAKPKQKLIRDSFTIPKNEYVVLEELKQRAIRSGRSAKKSEILRAGIGVLKLMTDAALLAALASVPSLKTGRPKDAKKVPGKVTSKKK
jgi:hypothetical protein